MNTSQLISLTSWGWFLTVISTMSPKTTCISSRDQRTPWDIQESIVFRGNVNMPTIGIRLTPNSAEWSLQASETRLSSTWPSCSTTQTYLSTVTLCAESKCAIQLSTKWKPLWLTSPLEDQLWATCSQSLSQPCFSWSSASLRDFLLRITSTWSFKSTSLSSTSLQLCKLNKDNYWSDHFNS